MKSVPFIQGNRQMKSYRPTPEFPMETEAGEREGKEEGKKKSVNM